MVRESDITPDPAYLCDIRVPGTSPSSIPSKRLNQTWSRRAIISSHKCCSGCETLCHWVLSNQMEHHCKGVLTTPHQNIFAQVKGTSQHEKWSSLISTSESDEPTMYPQTSGYPVCSPRCWLHVGRTSFPLCTP